MTTEERRGLTNSYLIDAGNAFDTAVQMGGQTHLQVDKVALGLACLTRALQSLDDRLAEIEDAVGVLGADD